MGDITSHFSEGLVMIMKTLCWNCRFLGGERFCYLNIDSNSKTEHEN